MRERPEKKMRLNEKKMRWGKMENREKWEQKEYEEMRTK